MLKCFLAGLGGFIGSVFRYLLGLAFQSLFPVFPFGTLLINFTGSLLIGLITEFSTEILPIHPNLMIFLTVGICGGFTTFSTFSLETVRLFERGKLPAAAAYVLLSMALCIIGVIIGKSVIRYFAAD